MCDDVELKNKQYDNFSDNSIIFQLVPFGHTIFPQLLTVGTINFGLYLPVGTIRGWEQNEGEVNSIC